MLTRFRGKDRKIVVGVLFDRTGTHLVRSAESLALRTGMTLRLVHVIELPPLTYEAYDPYSIGYATSQLPHLNESQRQQEAMAALGSFKAEIDPSINVELSTPIGNPATALMAEAQAQDASLLLCAVRPLGHKFVPKGLSTALTLLADCPVPILALRVEEAATAGSPLLPVSFNKQHLTIIVGDDLSEYSIGAVTTACELALNLGSTRLIHVHVHEQTRAEMEDMAKAVVSILLQKGATPEQRYSPNEVFATVSNQLKQAMDRRLGVLGDLVVAEHGNQYEQCVLFGDTFEKFSWAVRNKHPDIVVFGRHHLVHKKPFALGKMPTFAMLNLGCPVLVAKAHA